MKIRPVGAEFFHVDGRTDGHDEVNRRFTQIWKRSYKTERNDSARKYGAIRPA